VLPAATGAGVSAAQEYLVLPPLEPKPAPAFQAEAAQLPVRLWRRIKEVCPEALAVGVAITSPGQVQVRLRVADPGDGDRLTARIRALPDLSPYHLEVSVQRAR
jgi:hypothetical protein